MRQKYQTEIPNKIMKKYQKEKVSDRSAK